MLKLTFKQTQAEVIVRAASTIIFNTLNRAGYPIVALSELADNPQYGFTASASFEQVGAKFVRITDLKDGGIKWDTVPYCKCDQPEKYLIYPNDILFARTGATTGKTHLVKEAPYAIFASYLIRIRPKPLVDPEYLYSFFQSDAYWTQILDEKEGSAQPNVNGQKLMNILVPMVGSEIQSAISNFLEVVRNRQDGSFEELPELPPPMKEQRRIVARVEELAGKIEEVRSLRKEALEETEVLVSSSLSQIFDYQISDKLPNGWKWKALGELLLNNKEGMTTGPFGTLLQKSEIQSEGVPVLGIANVQANRFVPGFIDYVSPWKAQTLSSYKLQPDDIVIARSGTVGRSCVVPLGLEPAPIISTNLIKLRLDKQTFLPELLCRLFNGSRLIERHKDSECRGSTRSFFTQTILLRLKIPVPPIPEQCRIVAYLDELQAKVNTMKRHREEAMKELDALLPSILDKAFKGEL
ncbi:restriction endonuclease subunit S [Brasilonema sp. CT11]|nr:restriction endonuclease subunit S [Brasilonema sp. CT11]